MFMLGSIRNTCLSFPVSIALAIGTVLPGVNFIENDTMALQRSKSRVVKIMSEEAHVATLSSARSIPVLDIDLESMMGDPVSPDLFGAEFLGWRAFSDFDSRFSELGLRHMRWPGGDPVEIGVDKDDDGIRDTVYDLRFNNYVDWDRHTGRRREGIREILSYAAERRISLSIVVPTQRYAEEIIRTNRGKGTRKARRDIRGFVTKILDGNFGPVPAEITIEIGSEYYNTDVWRKYWNDPGIDIAAVYGDVFAAMASEIASVRRDFPDAPTNLEIAVQMGRVGGPDNHHGGNFADNRVFVETFRETGALDDLDGLIYHRYVPNFWGIERALHVPANGHTLQEAMTIWQDAAGRKLDLTAGYVSPTLRSDHDIEHGKVGLTNLLQLATSLAENGVDEGTVFGLGSSGPGTLGFRSDVLINGKLLGMMAESLPGMRIIRGYKENISPVKTVFKDGDIVRERLITSRHINKYVFADANKVVIFLVAKRFRGNRLSLTLRFQESFDQAQITRLVPRNAYRRNGVFLGHNGDLSTDTLRMRSWSGGSLADVTFARNYEVIRLVLNKSRAKSSARPDTFKGSMGNDMFYVDHPGDRIIEHPDGGYDTVVSEIGFSLRGQSQYLEELRLNGDSSVFATGNSLDNTIIGNSGSNRINGAWGNDILVGGEGDDIFEDDAGNDIMTGGSGRDVFKFRGNFGTDVITDFDPRGEGDILDFSGLADIQNYQDMIQNHVRRRRDGLVIFDRPGGNRVKLEGVFITHISERNFRF